MPIEDRSLSSKDEERLNETEAEADQYREAIHERQDGTAGASSPDACMRRWRFYRDSQAEDIFASSDPGHDDIADPVQIWEDVIQQRSTTDSQDDRDRFVQAVEEVRDDCGIRGDTVADEHWLFPILARTLERVRHGDYTEDLSRLLEPVAAVTVADDFEDYHALNRSEGSNVYRGEGAAITGQRVTGHNAGKYLSQGQVSSAAVYGHNALNHISYTRIEDSLIAGHHPLKGSDGRYQVPRHASMWERPPKGTEHVDIENSILVGHSVLEYADDVSVTDSIIATRYGDLASAEVELENTYVMDGSTISYYETGHAREEPDAVIDLEDLYGEVRLE
ncbi:MAG: hypothetical protein SVU32_07570 [Candidatus Nanohaloarchaea archaeon]|nr:hypothetical protein [Candidatus Nanohaloarchaea archaeon]